MNQNDLRVIKTKKNIESALIALLKEKAFSAITVQDILNKALINRTTFYKHYQDKYQLVERMNEQILFAVKTGVAERFLCKTTEELMECIKQLYQDLLEKREVILALFSIHTESLHLYDDIVFLLQQLFAQYYLRKHDRKDLMGDYCATLYASLVMTTVNWCLVNESGYEILWRNLDFFLVFKELF